jgi:hypothetical protein
LSHSVRLLATGKKSSNFHNCQGFPKSVWGARQLNPLDHWRLLTVYVLQIDSFTAQHHFLKSQLWLRHGTENEFSFFILKN